MEQRVRGILETAFPGITVDTEVLTDGRIVGHVVWEGFGELDNVGRQTKVRDVLRKELGVDAQEVGVLLTYTPAEMEAMTAGEPGAPPRRRRTHPSPEKVRHVVASRVGNVGDQARGVDRETRRDIEVQRELERLQEQMHSMEDDLRNLIAKIKL